MKITNVSTYILKDKLKTPTAYGNGIISSRSSVIIKIETDEGITGYGESMCHGNMPPEPAKAIIDSWLKNIIMNQNPLDTEVLWEKMYNATLQVGQSGLAINAMSGIDIALWDITGKALQKPIYQLLGGSYRDSIRPYATGFYKTENYGVKDAIEEAKTYLDQGFSAIKLAVGFGVEDDIEYINGVREGLGDNIRIMADANCAYNTATARRLLLAVREAKLWFFEELLAPDDFEGFKELKTLTETYIATGENLFTKRNYRRWISGRVADIFQPEIASCGGITGLKQIAVLANAYDVCIIPHNWGSGIGQAATVQYIANLKPVPLSLVPTFEPMMEFDQSEHPFSKDLVKGGIYMKNGMIPVPQGFGLGVDIDESVIKHYSE